VNAATPFSAQEIAWYLQGAFFNTAVVQMSEANGRTSCCHRRARRSPARTRRDGRRGRRAPTGRRRNAAVHPACSGSRHKDHLGADSRWPPRTAARRLGAGSSTTWPSSGPGRRPTTRSNPAPVACAAPQGRAFSFLRRGREPGPVHARGIAPVIAARRHPRSAAPLHAGVLVAHEPVAATAAAPAYLTPVGVTGPGRPRLWAMRLRDRWAGRRPRRTANGVRSWMVVRRTPAEALRELLERLSVDTERETGPAVLHRRSRLILLFSRGSPAARQGRPARRWSAEMLARPTRPSLLARCCPRSRRPVPAQLLPVCTSWVGRLVLFMFQAG